MRTALTLVLALAAAPAPAAPLDRMRDVLGPVVMDLLDPAMSDVVSAADLSAARQAGLYAPGQRLFAPFPSSSGGAVQSLRMSLEATGYETLATLGVPFDAVEALVSFGELPEDGLAYVLADADAAGAVMAHLGARADASALEGGRILLGSAPGALDMDWPRERTDPIRGDMPFGQVVAAEGARVTVGRSEAAVARMVGDGTVPADGEGTPYPAEVAALMAGAQEGLLSALDAVLPAEAKVVGLNLLPVSNAGLDPSVLTGMTGEAADMAALEEMMATALPPWLGGAVADYVMPDGRRGAAVAVNYFGDCAGAATAAEAVRGRWAGAPVSADTSDTAEARFGPPLAVAAPTQGRFCMTAFATEAAAPEEGKRPHSVYLTNLMIMRSLALLR